MPAIKDKTRVLHLITGSFIAGAENVILTVAEGMKGSQFESEICTLTPTGDLHKKANQIAIKSYALGYKNILSLPKIIIKLMLLLYKNKYDIINTHLPQASVIGIIISRLRGIPYIIETRHYSDYMYKYSNRINQWLDKKTVNMADHVIVVSHAGKVVLMNREGVKEEKISVIYNGINISKFSSNHRIQIRKQLGIDNKMVLTFTASYHPRKGHKYLLESVGMLKKKYPDVIILLIGDGILKANLEALTKQLHLEDNVRFLGYRTDIPELLNATDIYVHSSVEEGFGIAIIEAMAAGLPVIATNVGGIPEIITHNKNGILVPPEDPQALSSAMSDLIDHPDKRKTLAESGRRHVGANFTDETMVNKYREVYRSNVGK